jgi:sugar lactone lactonase YvrE
VAELQTLLTGLAFGESPRWHDGRLWFADWGTQEVLAVGLDGKSQVIVRVPTARPETRLDFGGPGRVLMVAAPAPGAGWP